MINQSSISIVNDLKDNNIINIINVWTMVVFDAKCYAKRSDYDQSPLESAVDQMDYMPAITTDPN